MIGITVWGLFRNYSWSYLGVWFFGILAATSSFVPIVDLIFEHRMYLSLAAPILLFVITVYLCFQYAVKRFGAREAAMTSPVVGGFKRGARVVLMTAIIAVPTLATLWRNGHYRRPALIWQSTLDVVPHNPHAHLGLGVAFQSEGRFDEAASHFREAFRLRPNYAEAHSNLGNVMLAQGKFDEAMSSYRRALHLKPEFAQARSNLGNVLLVLDRLEEAESCYRKALDLNPGFAEAHNNLGTALSEQGRFEEAIICYREALRLKPYYAKAKSNLVGELVSQGRLDEAISCYRLYHGTLRHKPDDLEMYYDFGNALLLRREFDKAENCYRHALKLKPDSAKVQNNLGSALLAQGRFDAAIERFNEALRLEPDIVTPLFGIAWILATHPDPERRDAPQAVELAERAIGSTEYPSALNFDTLAASYAAAGRFDEAEATAQRALNLASEARDIRLAGQIRKRLGLYQQEKPHRESTEHPESGQSQGTIPP
jgi:tetratricopeptide (TPR) repeat protein